MIFNKRRLKLANGQKVKEGDLLCFIDSDNNHRVMNLQYDSKRRKLVFCNADYSPNDYPGLKKCCCKNELHTRLTGGFYGKEICR